MVVVAVVVVAVVLVLVFVVVIVVVVVVVVVVVILHLKILSNYFKNPGKKLTGKSRTQSPILPRYTPVIPCNLPRSLLCHLPCLFSRTPVQSPVLILP